MHKTKQKHPFGPTFSLFEGLPPIFPNCYPLFDRIGVITVIGPDKLKKLQIPLQRDGRRH